METITKWALYIQCNTEACSHIVAMEKQQVLLIGLCVYACVYVDIGM
jgi:hypothetical protein